MQRIDIAARAVHDAQANALGAVEAALAQARARATERRRQIDAERERAVAGARDRSAQTVVESALIARDARPLTPTDNAAGVAPVDHFSAILPANPTRTDPTRDGSGFVNDNPDPHATESGASTALDAAERTRTERLAMVDLELASEVERLARLRRTAEERYRRVVDDLAPYGARIPPRVRPATDVSADPETLDRALDALEAASAAASRALRDVQREEERARSRTQQVEGERHAADARASGGLQRKHELAQLPHARLPCEGATAAETARAQADATRRRRIRFALIAAAGTLAVAVIVVVAVLATN